MAAPPPLLVGPKPLSLGMFQISYCGTLKLSHASGISDGLTEETAMKSSILDSGHSPKSAHAPLDRRYAERVPIHYRVIYNGVAGARLVKTEGSLRDLSKTGCKVLGTILPAVGCNLTITLYLEDGQAPMCLADATVSWISGSVFAVRFPKLTAEERKRIQEVIWKHVTLSPSKNHRAAFRIVA